jgi:hypothetical protein
LREAGVLVDDLGFELFFAGVLPSELASSVFSGVDFFVAAGGFFAESSSKSSSESSISTQSRSTEGVVEKVPEYCFGLFAAGILQSELESQASGGVDFFAFAGVGLFVDAVFSADVADSATGVPLFQELIFCDSTAAFFSLAIALACFFSCAKAAQ